MPGTSLPLNRLTDNDNFRLPTLTLNNYYPYGMLQAGRSRNAGGYRFGFQGQEADNKIGGLGQHTTAQFWEYDTWAVKRWNTDPVEHSTVSGYSVFMNNPIYYTDPYGLDTFNFNRKSWSATTPSGPTGGSTNDITINPGGSDVFFYNHTHSHTDANGNEKITSTTTRFYPDDPSGHNPDGLVSDVTTSPGAFGFGSYPDRGLTTLAKLAPSTLLEAYAANRPGSNNAFRKALIKQGDLSAYQTAQTLQGIFYLAEGGYTLWSAGNAIRRNIYFNNALEAQKKVIAEVSMLSKSEKRKISTIVGGYNTKTGQVSVGIKTNEIECAEDLVVQQLGGNAKDILLTPAYRPRDGSIIPVCPRCQLQYSRNQFPPGTTFGTKKKK